MTNNVMIENLPVTDAFLKQKRLIQDFFGVPLR
jgi:hypothetical protein